MTHACLRFAVAAVAGILLTTPFAARAERIKDLATVAGVRGNQLIGYGLVVGLDGTGDQTSSHRKMLIGLARRVARVLQSRHGRCG